MIQSQPSVLNVTLHHQVHEPQDGPHRVRFLAIVLHNILRVFSMVTRSEVDTMHGKLPMGVEVAQQVPDG